MKKALIKTNDSSYKLTDIIDKIKLKFDIDEIKISNIYDNELLTDRFDLIITVGGDGTFLSGAREAVRSVCPILGLYKGTLGFLTEMTIDEFLKCDIDNSIKYLNRDSLILKNSYKYNEIIIHNAINDIVLKGINNSIVSYIIYVDNDKVGTFTGDGVIVSSPIGSTAYNLSINGPIIAPNAKGIIINNIGTHTLFNRPLIIPHYEEIKIIPIGLNYSIYIDGQEINDKKEKESLLELKISNFENSFQVIKLTNKSFYDILGSKLHWNT